MIRKEDDMQTMNAKARWVATLRDIQDAISALESARDAANDGRTDLLVEELQFARHLALVAITRTRNEPDRARREITESGTA